MPIYEYQCQKCGEQSEHLQKMSDPPITVCERCGGELSRLISKSAFHLKGGGWYKDLYSTPRVGNGSSDGAKSGEKHGNGSGAKTSEKTDASPPKPAGDSAAKATASKD